MAGTRRIQRSVRVTVSAALMVGAFIVVEAAVVMSALVGPAAVLAVLLGAVATRIMYAEVVHTRWQAACQRAEHARSFQAAMDRSHTDHQAYSALVARRIGERDRAIGELGGTVRMLERRVDEAESRVRREARRANEAQERLAAVLDEVLGTVDADADAAADAAGDALAKVLAVRSNPPTIADLLGWDAKVPAPATATTHPDAATVA
jgi:hypothetical protein